MKVRNWILRAAFLAPLVSLGLAMPAAAQTPAAAPQQPLKIAVINGDRALAESNIGTQVQQEGQAAATQWETRIRDKQTELDGLMAQAQEQRLTLTEEALARIQQQIDQLNVDLQRLRDDYQRAMTRFGDEAQNRINAVLIPAVEQLANQEGYDLILDTRIQGILYFADAIDATDQFIVMVNAQTPQRAAQQEEAAGGQPQNESRREGSGR
ncbi:MAG: OmpH family outer membrane protein [Acidobacteriota bacterium]|jgi:outer membrane protein